MKNKALHKIVINNPSFGKLNNSSIYITDELKNKLSETKAKDGIDFFSKLKQGRALQGLKHLIETVKSQGQGIELVLTTEDCKKDDKKYYVNYDSYRSSTSKRFFDLYRVTGLDGAKYFLGVKFPEDFTIEETLTANEVKKAKKNFHTVIDELVKRPKDTGKLIDKTSEVLSELKKEEKHLKTNINELKKIQASSSISYYMAKLKELETRLTKKYHETRGKHSWQNWIYENNWLFGLHYQKPIDRTKVGFNSIPDYLFPTLDGFLDILEIKLPSAEVIKEDISHTGSYTWSSDTNKAIGQVVNYLHEMELHQLLLKQNIERQYKEVYPTGIYTIKPRGFILIGQSTAWSPVQKEAFRKLNFSLSGIEVLTYTDLQNRGKRIIDLYNDKP